MKTKFFTLTAIILGLIACETELHDINAQRSSWHLIVMENGVETAAFNMEDSSIPVPTGGEVKVINNWNNQNKSFFYKMATTTFSFEMRERGSATGNEDITAEKWSVSYNGGNLHIDNPVGPVAIYNITGAKLGQYSNVSDISIFLQQGLYIVASGKYSAKLLVQNNGIGSGAAQEQSVTKSYVMSDPPIGLRSGVSLYSETTTAGYWNILINNNVAPIEMSSVETFQFIQSGKLAVNYKNGKFVTLDYNGSSFDSEPAQSTSDVNWDLLFKHCGANFDIFGNLYYSAAIGDKFVVYDVSRDKTTEVPISSIRPILFNPSELFPYESEITEDKYGQIGCSDWDNSGKSPFIGMIFKVLVHYADGTTGYTYQCKHLTEDRGDGYNEESFSNGCRIPVSFSETNGKLTIKTNVGEYTF